MRVHTVKYSIGAAGKYKLHVGLRSQATALPGSPFELYVAPSSAHARSTSLVESLPLTGVVGDGFSCSCTLAVSDRMGNRCVSGGANIVVDVNSPDAQSQCTDLENGSYKLEWKSTRSGTYKTQVKIDGVHVIGSPTTVKMFSGPPEVPKCEISGSGLKTALAGQAAVYIACKDRFANPLSSESLQGNALSFGLALLQVGEKEGRHTVVSMPFEGQWVKVEGGQKDSDGNEAESFEISYTAKEAGDFELHVWCDPDGSGTRQWLTGSPFSVRVTGVMPSIAGSTVEQIGASAITAGDSVTLRPQLRDEFGNASAATEGTFLVEVVSPDDRKPLELKPLRGLGLYEVSFDVSLKGAYYVHFY